MRETLYAPVLTKRDFVRRYRAGEFGNRAPTWDTLEEYLDSGYRGLVHIRNRIAGGVTWYNVEAEDVRDKARIIVAQTDHNWSDLYFSGMAPHEHNLLQGEVCQSTDHFDLTYSLVKGKPMRDALAEATQYASGIIAVGLLRATMNAKSYDWLEVLLERYPNHVIEFSIFSVNWGTLRGYNTTFWEVRLGY